jgi:hypothetical protein
MTAEWCVPRLGWIGWLVFLSLWLGVAVAGDESVRLGSYAGPKREWTRADMRATFDLWGQELARQFQIPVQFYHYDDPVEMRRDFLAGRINGVQADAMTLVRYFAPEELADGYLSVMQGGWNTLLFAPRSGARDLTELAGKRIAVLEEDVPGILYLESLCLRHYQRDCKDVFSEIERVSTSNQALMKVFFGKADLALVIGYGYEVAIEMNPQLARSLRKLAERPMSGQYFAFYSAKVDKELRQRTLKVIPMLHTYPRGRQLLDIFKIDHLALAQPSELLPFLQLEREVRELRARVQRGKARPR